MPQISQVFQPPRFWQEFEELTRGVFSKVFEDPSPNMVGRPGQAQNGVDVYGRCRRHGLVGIQCKRLDDLDENNEPHPGGVITAKILNEEIKKAEKFSPTLGFWILATTAKRDEAIQRRARQLDEERTKSGRFGVGLWFWDDYVSQLNIHPELQRWYYEKILNFFSAADQDRMILETIATAFKRPAFEVPLQHEKFDEFLQAVSDTQAALRTGELVNREKRHVILKAVGGWRFLTKEECREALRRVESDLKQLRSKLVEGTKTGKLIQRQGYLEVTDPLLGNELENLRQKCLSDLDEALHAAGLPRL